MIEYKVGDATDPELPENGTSVIAHIVNDKGGWGAGFSGALSKRYPVVEKIYRQYAEKGELELGKNIYVGISKDLFVVNMIAQHHWRPYVDQPIRYEALADCLTSLHKMSRRMYFTQIFMPRIGAGLAGGDWSIIEEMINKTFSDNISGIDYIPVTVYDLP